MRASLPILGTLTLKESLLCEVESLLELKAGARRVAGEQEADELLVAVDELLSYDESACAPGGSARSPTQPWSCSTSNTADPSPPVTPRDAVLPGQSR